MRLTEKMYVLDELHLNMSYTAAAMSILKAKSMYKQKKAKLCADELEENASRGSQESVFPL